MPLFCHAAHKLGIALYQVFEDKKRAADLLLAENVEYLLNISVFVSRVKREIHDLIALFGSRFVYIYAAVFRKIGKLRRARRDFPVLFMLAVPAGGVYRYCKNHGQSREHK